MTDQETSDLVAGAMTETIARAFKQAAAAISELDAMNVGMTAADAVTCLYEMADAIEREKQ